MCKDHCPDRHAGIGHKFFLGLMHIVPTDIWTIFVQYLCNIWAHFVHNLRNICAQFVQYLCTFRNALQIVPTVFCAVHSVRSNTSQNRGEPFRKIYFLMLWPSDHFT